MSVSIEKLQESLRKAQTFEQWKHAAQSLDDIEGNTNWKYSESSEIYNYALIKDRLTLLRQFKKENRTEELYRSLREGLHHDLGNMGDARLYQECYFGTKKLVEEYVDEVCDSLILVSQAHLNGISTSKKLDFFRDTLLSYGRPALLLSGGASLGVFHLGVVKALWEQNLLPQVINGSSAGSIVAAVLGTHTDEEIPKLFDPEQIDLSVWRWQGLSQGLRGKGFMDPAQLKEKVRTLVGEYTMEEAFERTGRSINISVSPVHTHQMPRLLCGYTSPYILLWSAVMASCAVPAIFPPVKLTKKDVEGHYKPYMPRLRWVDGTVMSDLPIERLRHLYDVNYTIVSQTNPHIVPFLNGDQAAKRKKLTRLPIDIAKAELKFHGAGIFNYIRDKVDSELVRQAAGHAHSIVAQNYYGDVTISPVYKLNHYARILSNPSPKFIKELMLEGERATWPQISMIRTHAKISQTLETIISDLKQSLRSGKPSLSIVASKRSSG